MGYVLLDVTAGYDVPPLVPLARSLGDVAARFMSAILL